MKVALTLSQVEELIAELTHAAEVYYQKLGTSPLTDEEFDAKTEYLRTLEEDGLYPEIFAAGSAGFLILEGDPSLGTKTKADDVVKHAVPMLSLGKAQTPDQLSSFLTKARISGAKDFRLQAKLDGFALSAEYKNGALTFLSTRGNGETGENISYLLNHAEVKIEGLPDQVSDTAELEVRGELFLTTPQFKAVDEARLAALGGERYKLSRNALVGIIKKAKLGLGYSAPVTFAAYAVLRNGKPADMDTITSEGFLTVDALTASIAGAVPLSHFADDAAVLAAVAAFGKARENFPIPTDGVVIKPTNEAELLVSMGASSHHPRSQVAYKFPAPTAVTELLAIDLSVGKTGKITPIGRIRPVDLDGSTISNLSLHNFNILYAQNIRVGQTVMIHKANDIIPQVKAVISTPEGAELLPVPTTCPVCGDDLHAAREEKGVWPPKTLLCGNRECPSRDFFALKTAVMKGYLDIDGLSEVSLEHLNSIGRVTTIADLYTLTREELADSELGKSSQGNPRRLGEKRADHILEYIEKSKELPLPRVLASLSIPMLGRTISKALIKAFGDFEGIRAASVDEIAALDGFGLTRAEAIVTGLQHRAPLIAQLQERGVKFQVPAADADAAPPALAGLAFAISGTVPEPFANRAAWIDYVEAHGGTFHSGPKAGTSFMVGDPEETSSKVKKAKSLAIPFLTPAEFTERFGSH